MGFPDPQIDFSMLRTFINECGDPSCRRSVGSDTMLYGVLPQFAGGRHSRDSRPRPTTR